ncbi:MAG TPA: cytochrome P450 [Verrucomicrobiae bacterium]|nr:cytochrome P450 [Verrucomicrobiae bacterium]
MLNLFADDVRRDPYPLYDQIRAASPLFRDPNSGLLMVFDYEGAKRVLNDHDAFSSRIGPAEWIIFMDPPRHSKLRALISQAFTPRSITNLEPRIRELSRDLLDGVIDRGEMDLATDFAIPLPMMVIAEMLGAPVADRPRFRVWNDVLLDMSYTVPGGEKAAGAMNEFMAATAEMNDYLSALTEDRRSHPKDDLLTRMVQAQVDGECLSPHDILGFFQVLLLAGSETTTNLINNAILCFIDNPDQLARLRGMPHLMPSAIEEVLRYRSPLQWMLRVAKHDLELHGQTIPKGKAVLPMIGAANRDPKVFQDANRFDIARNPNPHIAFGHGIHFCLGAVLARVEGRVALTDLLGRMANIQLSTKEPWEPRRGLHVHGPSSLPIRFTRIQL